MIKVIEPEPFGIHSLRRHQRGHNKDHHHEKKQNDGKFDGSKKRPDEIRFFQWFLPLKKRKFFQKT